MGSISNIICVQKRTIMMDFPEQWGVRYAEKSFYHQSGDLVLQSVKSLTGLWMIISRPFWGYQICKIDWQGNYLWIKRNPLSAIILIYTIIFSRHSTVCKWRSSNIWCCHPGASRVELRCHRPPDGSHIPLAFQQQRRRNRSN